MKFEDFWQENKRFVTIVAAGAIVFGVGWASIQSTLGSELTSARARLRALDQQLAQPRYAQADQERAQSERDRLAAAVGTLTSAVSFEARPEFRLDGSTSANRYFAVSAKSREELLSACNRAGLAVPESLGLPALSPTKEQEIVRDLEALDVIDRVLRLAIEAQCERVDEIRIKLDPRLLSGKPIVDVEKTLVEFSFTGSAAPMCKLIALSQQQRATHPLLIERASLTSSRTKTDESKLELSFLIAHLYGDGAAASSGSDQAKADPK